MCKALCPAAWLLSDLSLEEGGDRGEATEEVVSLFPVFRQASPVRDRVPCLGRMSGGHREAEMKRDQEQSYELK